MRMSGLSTGQIALIVGLVIGVALGLVYTWVIAPVELVNTLPPLLRFDYRQDWIRLAALSYVANGNLKQARARLDGIKQEDVASAIQALIEEYAAAGLPAETLRNLTSLAEVLDVHTPAMLVYLDTPASSAPGSTRTPSPTPTLRAESQGDTPTPTRTPTSHTPSPVTTPPRRPTRTPTPTPFISSPLPTPTSESTSTLPPPTPTPTPPLLARLQLAEQEQICQPGQTPRIEVVVRDERGAGLAGVEVWLMWPGGADRAVTGLKPQSGAGYADFNVERGVKHSLGVGELGLPLVTDLRIEPCPVGEDEESLIGSWRIVLEPRPPETE